MRNRFTWIAALLALTAIGFFVACSSNYSTSNNGLVVVPNYNTLVMETFSLDLANGHTAQVNNTNGPPIPGLPTNILLDPSGSYAYLIVNASSAAPGSSTGIASFQVNSDGKLGAPTTTALNSTILTVGGNCETIPVSPVAIAIDSGGKFLFVANSATADSSGNPVPGSISVLSVSNGSLSEVNPVTCSNPTAAGSPFPLPVQASGAPNASALAVSATVFPIQFAPCSGQTPPSTENLYVTDSVNYQVLNYSVASDGTLALIPPQTGMGVPTGSVPAGVAVDPCNRFVFVSNSNSQNVSAYTVCSVPNVAENCPTADFHLQEVSGSPFPAGDVPGPLAVYPFGTFLFVVDTGSSQVSGYKIGTATGALTVLSGFPVATNSEPNSIAIRSDGTWMFVANYNSSTISEYAITPATGSVTTQTPFSTIGNPTGVAVK
jgi:6-phosphogluconolactonase